MSPKTTKKVKNRKKNKKDKKKKDNAEIKPKTNTDDSFI